MIGTWAAPTAAIAEVENGKSACHSPGRIWPMLIDCEPYEAVRFVTFVEVIAVIETFVRFVTVEGPIAA